MSLTHPKYHLVRLEAQECQELRQLCCGAMLGDANRADQGQTSKCTIQRFRSHSGEDKEENLITLCTDCHSSAHK